MATAPMITIKDVARLADVGVGTVSRVLSGNGSVSDETALRVRAAVARLGYRPSSIARALALRRSGAIGVYIPVFDGSYYSGLMASIDTQLRANGRHMIAANGCGDGEPRQQELDGIEFLLRCDCDGLLVASLLLLFMFLLMTYARDGAELVGRALRVGFENEELAQRARALGADVILVSQIITQRDCHKENAAALVALLKEQGWRDKVILLLGGPRIDNKLARELGFDAGFGPGTLPSLVAAFIVAEVSRKA